MDELTFANALLDLFGQIDDHVAILSSRVIGGGVNLSSKNSIC
jgi:hypothetical protein